ncbi:hypothetical protein [Verrucosispora sp. WMMC514]|uniref:hypothetical protein n=1 Tax=Verrucosispora sp. WMMC514 TaxID=3015156 RepID=UPI00248CE58D|nr:hypothetical protein [Verrucosispora sp. WMMC514]WBB89960.1 hypothetical protein O7597_23690 [Verrucosispora sp. WMMC514]
MLTIVAIQQRTATTSPDLVELSLAETRRLLNCSIHTSTPTAVVLAWSRWRRRQPSPREMQPLQAP